MTLRELLQGILSATHKNNLASIAEWPPDLFAVTAHYLVKTGKYLDVRYTDHRDSLYQFTPSYRSEVAAIASRWRNDPNTPAEVVSIWNELLANADIEINSLPAIQVDNIVMLMAIADESCRGVGMDVLFTQSESLICQEVNTQFFLADQSVRSANSICKIISPDYLAVLPKVSTPQVGCSIRSFSHHLALLPGIHEGKTEWSIAGDIRSEETDEFNILLFPFPFHIGEEELAPGDEISDASGLACYFKFIRDSPVDIAEKVFRVLVELVEESNKKGTPVHCIVLPELALSYECAQRVSMLLGGHFKDLELFISGSYRDRENFALSVLYTKLGRVTFEQAKHHRWRLNGSQINDYSLQGFSDRKLYWEQISLHSRKVTFYSVRRGAVMASLICEDLARIDPVQSIIRSVGPTLVVALLQDGPQLPYRWSARYSSVLADDPGSAVLTLTSIGMIRSNLRKYPDTQLLIAYWKNCSGQDKSLEIDEGAHGIVLKLKNTDSSQLTMDGRSDDNLTALLEYVDSFSVRSALAKELQW